MGYRNTNDRKKNKMAMETYQIKIVHIIMKTEVYQNYLMHIETNQTKFKCDATSVEDQAVGNMDTS